MTPGAPNGLTGWLAGCQVAVGIEWPCDQQRDTSWAMVAQMGRSFAGHCGGREFGQRMPPCRLSCPCQEVTCWVKVESRSRNDHVLSLSLPRSCFCDPADPLSHKSPVLAETPIIPLSLLRLSHFVVLLLCALSPVSSSSAFLTRPRGLVTSWMTGRTASIPKHEKKVALISNSNIRIPFCIYSLCIPAYTPLELISMSCHLGTVSWFCFRREGQAECLFAPWWLVFYICTALGPFYNTHHLETTLPRCSGSPMELGIYYNIPLGMTKGKSGLHTHE